MALARPLVAGVDVWLNTPLPPLEASGTSGMKAALNGVLNFSVLDGWWIEACIEGAPAGRSAMASSPATSRTRSTSTTSSRTSSCRSTTATAAGWIWMMKQAISKIAYYFNSQRMMRRYASEAYLR